MTDLSRTHRSRVLKRSRCGIYTRKSTEEGLDQNFNSLDAQREACAAYIQSQKHEGWTAVPTVYDDGGYSGGSLERPALQRLLADIEARRIDVIVVYKVDRLTRALSDFAKLVEVFDRCGVSFVSITQQFNTTTSMGRLTLNILLSFAQFERELIGERVRDKVAASRRKGIWMGGIVPLGYDVKDRKLIANKDEARTVVDIYRRYLRVKSVGALQVELDAAGIKSKRRVHRNGTAYGNQGFSQGALYLLLQNRTYRGEAMHKGNAYPGEHKAIIDKPLWDAVQSVLAENRIKRASGTNTKAPSLLTGLLFDETGERLTPTWSIKKGTRYRYYVSTSLIKGGRRVPSSRRRIPAGDLETIIAERVRKLLSNRGELLEAVDERDRSNIGHRQLIERGRKLAKDIGQAPESDRLLFRSLLSRVEVGSTSVSVDVSQVRLAALLESNHTELPSDPTSGSSGPILKLKVPVQLARVGEQMKLLVKDGDDNRPFVCLPDRKDRLMTALRKTLDISRNNPHGLAKTHFTIFPEYSIPGLDAVDEFTDAISVEAWPAGTVVIGGVQGLTKAEFQNLADRERTHLDHVNNNPDRVGPTEWVNCSVTWVKGANGQVEKWLQPKIAPAWEELAIHHNAMFRGNSIFSFKGALENQTRFRFSSLLCFDWIASIANRSTWRWVLDDLNVEAGEGEISLSWFFVIQKNPQPSHLTFLNQVQGFFDATVLPNVNRERTCLLFANSAGRDTPGRSDTYGGASLIFTKNTRFQEESSRPTVSKGGTTFRNTGALGNQRDAYFREKGACIHSFVQTNPVLAGGANARHFAVDRAYVFPVDDTADPRVPSDVVPACVKWVNDELDSVKGIPTIYPNEDLTPQAATAHGEVVSSLRLLDSKETCRIITLSTPKSAYPERVSPDDADLWGRIQTEAILHVVHSVTLLRVAAGAAVAPGNRGHAAVTFDGETLDIVAVRGKSHQDCNDHGQNFTGGARRKVIFVSRDQENSRLGKRAGSFLEPKKAGIGREQKVTDPSSGRIYLDYQTILQLFQASATPVELLRALHAQLAA